MDSRTEANINQLASDVHFATAPLRFLWHAVLWFVFLLFAPIIFTAVPILAIKHASPDDIWLLKWLFGVLGPFASTFWFVIIAMIPAHKRGEDGLAFHIKSFGALALGFVVSAGAMFMFATNYTVRYEWDDRGWFTGAWLCLLSPFALLYVWWLLRRVLFGRG